MALRRKNNRLEPEGGKSSKFGGALDGIKDDELITVRQMVKYLNGELVTIPGAFTNINANQAIKLKTPGNTFVYIPLLIYP